MAELLQLDQQLFHLINSDWHNPFMDAIMPYWRDKKFWIPLYILIAGLCIYKFRVQGLYLILGAVMTIAIADPISSQLVKKNVQRIRPCNDILIKEQVELLIPCGGGYSFTSSHATNHFAIAVFLIFTLGKLYPWIRIPLILWAASIAFGQVYVGVHYPLDIIGGGILGTLIGYLVAKVFLRIPGIQNTFNKKTKVVA